jgi:cyclomaltodextrinase
MQHWANDAVFYHIYPLGFCGAPPQNDFHWPAVHRLEHIIGWLDHLENLGITAIYLGPVFESSRHGYDTVDYYHVDRRLGNNETLKRLIAAIHARGMRVILDGVFNHVGRDFWAFYDLRQNGERSLYRDWFHGVRFGERSRYGDPFTYTGWEGHYSLVKLNLGNPAVREHLLGALALWLDEFEIDGLRLDAADQVDPAFWRELAAFCRHRCWLMGEVIHGDYRRWANPAMLHSVTNYECYKGLWSSHVDRNYFEIAYALKRQFGADGLYRGLPLYNFADNHDVDRVASRLTNPAHLYPLYALLFTMPGVPSIYYGSEWGITGRKSNGSDAALRPFLQLPEIMRSAPHPELAEAIRRLIALRRRLPALRQGNYEQLHIAHEQFAFARRTNDQCVIVAVNAAEHAVPVEVTLPVSGTLVLDELSPSDLFHVNEGRARFDVPPRWARVLRLE